MTGKLDKVDVLNRMKQRADACPNAANHTPWPEGYSDFFEWAEHKAITHTQTQCPGCQLWNVWIPKSYQKSLKRKEKE